MAGLQFWKNIFFRLCLNESRERLGQKGEGRSFPERRLHLSEAVAVIHTFVKMEEKSGFISIKTSSEISKLSQTKNKCSRTPLHAKDQHSAQTSAIKPFTA